ncbi:MAG: cadmium-translocating P-type ATPase [Saprospiraceae bacterium]|nr:cadmium-translocating P-type ATPase [Saprospiraceae bacterium]
MEKHTHIYDADGNQLCCTLEKKIAERTHVELSPKRKKHVHHPGEAGHHDHAHDSEHDHDHGDSFGHPLSIWSLFRPVVISFLLLIVGISLDHFHPAFYNQYLRTVLYIIAFFPVGWPVVKYAWKGIQEGEIFSEFFLMSLATISAMAIGEYPEAVAVMLFYMTGESLQTLAVRRVKANIKNMLDQRPDVVSIVEGNQTRTVAAADVAIGTIIQLNPGEKAGLDGILLSEEADFNTAALTGESVPIRKVRNDEILAGMISLHTSCKMQVTRLYQDSKLSHILEMVQEASARKAPTELFIRKFARAYTPVVVFLAVTICIIPYFIVADYHFKEWLYRALIFLVISCPCALVISIPLGYLGGIGACSRNGILVKGGNFLDTLAALKHVVVDKTGTMTMGNFEVKDVFIPDPAERNHILTTLKALQAFSTHPIAGAISRYVPEDVSHIEVTDVKEFAGKGMSGLINGVPVLAGNLALLKERNIIYPAELDQISYTLVAICMNHSYAGCITIADVIKNNAKEVVQKLKEMNIGLTMLSGDSNKVVAAVAGEIGINSAFGSLLPEDKVNRLKAIQKNDAPVAFIGDGLNDAPVLVTSDVGIAMGGLGSDMTIESADVVIQDDDIMKIPKAIFLGKKTKQIVWQNILLAFVVKGVVLLLGASGHATMWEAVFADVGVALLAVGNAIRIQRM